MPAARHRSRSPSNAEAVSATFLMCAAVEIVLAQISLVAW